MKNEKNHSWHNTIRTVSQSNKPCPQNGAWLLFNTEQDSIGYQERPCLSKWVSRDAHGPEIEFVRALKSTHALACNEGHRFLSELKVFEWLHKEERTLVLNYTWHINVSSCNLWHFHQITQTQQCLSFLSSISFK